MYAIVRDYYGSRLHGTAGSTTPARGALSPRRRDPRAPAGAVTGVDMTVEQLAVAKRPLKYHAEAFGYANVHLRHGYIERLDELDLEPASFDVIVSNCVVNLSPDKDAALRGGWRLLKPG